MLGHSVPAAEFADVRQCLSTLLLVMYASCKQQEQSQRVCKGLPTTHGVSRAHAGLVGAIRLSHHVALAPAKLMLATLWAAAVHCCTALSGAGADLSCLPVLHPQ